MYYFAAINIHNSCAKKKKKTHTQRNGTHVSFFEIAELGRQNPREYTLNAILKANKALNTYQYNITELSRIQFLYRRNMHIRSSGDKTM